MLGCVFIILGTKTCGCLLSVPAVIVMDRCACRMGDSPPIPENCQVERNDEGRYGSSALLGFRAAGLGFRVAPPPQRRQIYVQLAASSLPVPGICQSNPL